MLFPAVPPPSPQTPLGDFGILRARAGEGGEPPPGVTSLRCAVEALPGDVQERNWIFPVSQQQTGYFQAALCVTISHVRAKRFDLRENWAYAEDLYRGA